MVSSLLDRMQRSLARSRSFSLRASCSLLTWSSRSSTQRNLSSMERCRRQRGRKITLLLFWEQPSAATFIMFCAVFNSVANSKNEQMCRIQHHHHLIFRILFYSSFFYSIILSLSHCCMVAIRLKENSSDVFPPVCLTIPPNIFYYIGCEILCRNLHYCLPLAFGLQQDIWYNDQDGTVVEKGSV